MRFVLMLALTAICAATQCARAWAEDKELRSKQIKGALLGGALGGVPGALIGAGVATKAHCPAKALDSADGPMGGVPTRSKSGVAACQSFATASLIDGYRNRHGGLKGHRTSPLMLYLATLKREGYKGEASGGLGSRGPSFTSIEQTLRDFGSCSDKFDEQVDSSQDDKELARFLERLGATFNEYKHKKLTRNDAIAELQCLIDGKEGGYKIPPEIADLDRIIAALERDNEVDFLNELLAKYCTGTNNLKPSLPRLVEKYDASMKDELLKRASGVHRAKYERDDAYVSSVRGEIDKLLDSGNPPIMNHCANGYLQYGPGKARLNPLKDGQNCGNHAVIVVGREMRGGQCMYRIRNSWGTGCERYKTIPERYKNCENGDLWLTADDIQNTAFGVTHFESW